MAPAELDTLCINTIRFLSVDAVQKANSGHPGMPLGAAPMAYLLWTRFLEHNPKDPGWFDRDRFVLSGGHGSMLLYSLLHLTGYDLSLDEIKNFRQWESKTPGHPERGFAPGVETTTGPLGQGFANGVGMALAEADLAARYNRPGHAIIDHYTYGIVSDGDLMEGVASEAASLAGHWGLGKLIYLYDDNRITLAGAADLTFSEDRAERFRAYGWQTLVVEDGNDLARIDAGIRAAQAETKKPSLILVRTHIGYGSPKKQDSFEAHGSPLGPEEVKATKLKLGWPLEPAFYIPEEATGHLSEAVDQGARAQADWEARLAAYAKAHPEPARELQDLMAGRLTEGWDKDIPVFPADPKGMATRTASGRVMNAVAPRLPALIGGSADLNPSTQTVLKGLGDFENPDFQPADRQGEVGGGWGHAGRNIAFGVREHAMGGIVNGMAAHGGTLPYGATFFNFLDYMKPAVRLAALMELHVVHVFTHDSVGLGEDGPTHQPVEQLASLRAMPQCVVLRPADANETAVAWKVAIERTKWPVFLVLTRQAVPTLDRTKFASAEGVRKGAYVLQDAPGGKPDLLLIATGSEVSRAVQAAAKLTEKGRKVRVVSMPSWELFAEQDESYRESVLPKAVKKRLAIEAASPLGWERWVGSEGAVLGLSRFGASAPGETVLANLGFNVDNIVAKALELAAR